MTQKTFPGPRYPALLALLHAADLIWNGSRHFFAHWALSPSQFNVLNLLQGQLDGVSQIHLSRALIMHRSNLTGLIDQLEAKKLVRRQDDPADRRSYRVVISPAGARLVEEILPAYYRAAERLFAQVTPAAAQQLVRTLEKVSATALDLTTTLQKPAAGNPPSAPPLPL